MVAKWTRNNPIQAHLINMLIVILIMGTILVILIARYGKKIDDAYDYSRWTYERLIEITKSDTINNEQQSNNRSTKDS